MPADLVVIALGLALIVGSGYSFRECQAGAIRLGGMISQWLDD